MAFASLRHLQSGVIRKEIKMVTDDNLATCDDCGEIYNTDFGHHCRFAEAEAEYEDSMLDSYLDSFPE